MKKVGRRTFIRGLGGAVALAPGFRIVGSAAPTNANPALTHVNPKFMVTAKQVIDWHKFKDSKGGPTMTGSPSWHNYVELLEKELKAMKCEDIFRNSWKFQRWSTTEYPNDANWSLHVDGKKFKVASYRCNSGKTPDAGVTGELAAYVEGADPEKYRGKIVIVKKERGAGGSNGSDDYEFLSNPDTFPDPLHPRSEEGALSPFPIMGLGTAQAALIKGGALGAIIIMPLSYEALAGVYTFGVPALYDLPTLYLDRDEGAKLLESALKQKATLRLISTTEESEAYQLFGYLPGKHYETDEDQRILLVTHTDGPSISQENGGLGILSMLKYFSHIPQDERPRTLMAFFDCRHYMPGAERAFAQQNYASREPEVYKQVVAAMGIEHLGQMQVTEGQGKPYHKTGQPEMSSVWITNNQHMIDMAIKAVKYNGLRRVQVQCPGHKGLHGGEQGPWYGLGGIARTLGVPGASTMGSMTAYWSTKARMDYLDADHFVNQMATMTQICGELMVAEVESIKTVPAPAGRGRGRA